MNDVNLPTVARERSKIKDMGLKLSYRHCSVMYFRFKKSVIRTNSIGGKCESHITLMA